MQFKYQILAGAALYVVLTSAGAAYAQQAEPAKGSTSVEVQEVVVTAEKRSSTVEKTAISITAVSGKELVSRGLANFTSLAAGTPGVSMKTAGPGQTEFEMRGMTSSGGNSPTVGFYLDDIPLTAPASAQNGKVVIDPTLYDLDHVEILRGPQGTLYGSSSMGGTIKLVANKPKLDKTEASAEASLSGTEGGGFNHTENVMFNVPLAKDTLALRVVGSEATTSGWIDRVVVGDFPVATTTVNPGDTRGNVLAGPVLADHKQSNAEESSSVRATLLWNPTDALTVTPSVFYQTTHQNGPSDYDSAPGTQAHYQPFDIAEPYADWIAIGALNVNYHFNAFDLTSATSYWSRRSTMVQDNSENLPSDGGFGVTTDSASFYGPAGTGPIFAAEADTSNQFSEELRAASNGSGPLKWLAGAYYADFHSDWHLSETVPNPAAFGSPTSNIFLLSQPIHISQEALFGEATYSPITHLHLTGGLRVYHYSSILDMSFSGFGSATGDDAAITQHVVQNNTGVNPKVDISYDLGGNALIYATAARGFRPGGGNQPLPSSGPSPIAGPMYLALVALGYKNGVAPTSYGPDNLWSYEVGEKAKFFDNRLRINSSVYLEQWQNIQLEELPFGYPLFDNVNRANIYGAELEAQARPTDAFTFGGALGYTHATLGQTTHGFVAGQRLPDVPEYSGSAYASYQFQLSDRFNLVARVDDTYVGDRVGLGSAGGVVNATQAPLPSYNLINLRLTLNASDGWSAALFVNNLTDKHAYLEDVAQLGLPNPAYNRVATNQPMTIGMDLNAHF
jgi:outer membrane receptor protein involved in Fe transport